MHKIELKKQVEGLIVKLQLMKAFELLETFIVKSTFDYNELSKTIILKKTELNFIAQQMHNGIISDEKYKTAQSKLINTILFITDQIHENDVVDFVSSFKTQRECIHAIIVDDESNGITALKHMLTQDCPNVKIIETFQSSKDAYRYIKNQKPDLLFLDIHMPHMNGLELLKKLGYRNYNAIFTTAYKKHMLAALRLNAIDYLMKPIDKVDLISAVGRVQDELNGNLNSDQILNAIEQSQTGFSIGENTRFGIKAKNIIRFVQFSEMCYFKKTGNLTLAKLTDNSTIQSTESLNSIDSRLPDEYFFRCNRTYIINELHIKEHDELYRFVNMIDNEHISVSESRREDFKNFLNGILISR